MFGTGLLAPWLKRAREFQKQHHRANYLTRVDYLTAEVETLRKDIDHLSRHVNFERQIDLVLFNGLPIFMYVDDLGYPPIGSNRKLLDQPFETIAFLDKIHRPSASSLEGTAVAICLDHLIRHFSDFAAVDVGCRYGRFSLDLAYFLNHRGRCNAVYAFDAGIAGNLAPINFEMNQSMGKVEFCPYAMGDRDVWTLFFSDPGHTENDRLGNCVTEITRSRPVRMTTVDQFLRDHGGVRPTFLKVDTQGFDPEVIDGARETLAQPTIAISEFTPDAIRRRRCPAGFIRGLIERGFVIDMMHPARGPIAMEDAEAFAEAVDKTDMHWTDLICISRSVPDHDGLIELLKSQPPAIVA